MLMSSEGGFGYHCAEDGENIFATERCARGLLVLCTAVKRSLKQHDDATITGPVTNAGL